MLISSIKLHQPAYQSGYSVKGTSTIFVSMEKYDNIRYPAPYYWTENGSWLEYMSDLTVVINGGREFRVHKAILERRTDFFNHRYKNKHRPVKQKNKRDNIDELEDMGCQIVKDESNNTVEEGKDNKEKHKEEFEIKNNEEQLEIEESYNEIVISNLRLEMNDHSDEAEGKIDCDTTVDYNATQEEGLELIEDIEVSEIKDHHTETSSNRVNISWVANKGFIMVDSEQLKNNSDSINEIKENEDSNPQIQAIKSTDVSILSVDKLELNMENKLTVDVNKQTEEDMIKEEVSSNWQPEILHMPYLNERAFIAFLDYVYNRCHEDTGYVPCADQNPFVKPIQDDCTDGQDCKREVTFSNIDNEILHSPTPTASVSSTSALSNCNNGDNALDNLDTLKSTNIIVNSNADNGEIMDKDKLPSYHKSTTLPDKSWWGWPSIPEDMLALYRVCTKWKCPLLGDGVACRLSEMLDSTPDSSCADIALAAWTSGHELGTWNTGDPRFRDAVLRQFEAISQIDWAYDVPVKLLRNMLKDDKLNVWRGDEMMVLKFVMRWAVTRDGRRISQLLDSVRLELLDVDMLSCVSRSWLPKLPSNSRKILDYAWRKCQLRNDYIRGGMTVEVPPDMVIMRPRICPNQVGYMIYNKYTI